MVITLNLFSTNWWYGLREINVLKSANKLFLIRILKKYAKLVYSKYNLNVSFTLETKLCHVSMFVKKTRFRPFRIKEQTTSTNSKMKTILFYNSYFNMPSYEFGFGNQPFIDAKCPVTDCFTTDQVSLLGLSFKCK